ncbi:MAG: L-serine ammonia-lyase [Desulfopila sp.]
MFISTLDLFKVGIGPSSSHTMGPMLAGKTFRKQADKLAAVAPSSTLHIRCTLQGSLAATGKGHASDTAVLLGLHGYAPVDLIDEDIASLTRRLKALPLLSMSDKLLFDVEQDLVFATSQAVLEHPNTMHFTLAADDGRILLATTFLSIGGGFLATPEEFASVKERAALVDPTEYPYPFHSARTMLAMASASGLSIAGMKRANERVRLSEQDLDRGLDQLWRAMQSSVLAGLAATGPLPGPLGIARRARPLLARLQADPVRASVTDWLCAYAMAVAEENGAGHMVVTAPTNGAAGVIPAVLYYAVHHLGATTADIRIFLLTAAAIGGLIKHNSSISGAEVGCQGEIGSASAMAAAGLSAIRGGSPTQIEHAAEMALEHHLGMTCDPVAGLVQVPCIERNGFGAVKAFTAASLALLDEGRHFMSLDSCIEAMRQTGLAMSDQFKETSQGGLAICYTEC